MTPEERARETIVAWNKEYSGWKDNDLASLLGMDAYEHQTALIADTIRAAIAEEREACAKVCDDQRYHGQTDVATIQAANHALLDAAAAIRARS